MIPAHGHDRMSFPFERCKPFLVFGRTIGGSFGSGRAEKNLGNGAVG
jgi:hypothetical protein